MIYCIWYPPGGFGHYLASILSLRGDGFMRPEDPDFVISKNGNSHRTRLPVPKYWHDPDHYEYEFRDDMNYAVLIDNSFSSSQRFREVFPSAQVIKITYDDWSWPLLSRTMMEKAFYRDFDRAVLKDCDDQDWAKRERYFLFLKEHEFRLAWTPTQDQCISIWDIISHDRLQHKLAQFGLSHQPFDDMHQCFLEANKKYISPVQQARELMEHVHLGSYHDLSAFKDDLWAQAIVYYFIWLRYRFEVPHNDYADWFQDIDHIIKMLKDHQITP